MFTKYLEGNGREAIVREIEHLGVFRVTAKYWDANNVMISNQEDYKFKAAALRVAKSWIEFGA